MYNYTFGGHYECIPGKSVTVQEFLKAVSPETLYYFDLRFIPILASFYDLRMDTNSSALVNGGTVLCVKPIFLEIAIYLLFITTYDWLGFEPLLVLIK